MRPHIWALAALPFLVACRDCWSETHPGTCQLGEPGHAEDSATTADECATTEVAALAALETHCYACHGRGGTIEGGFNFVTDVQRLVQEELVVPGAADASYLFARVSGGTMPPAAITERPSAEEIATLRTWIDGCVTAEPVVLPYVTHEEVFATLYADLLEQDSAERPYVRYVSFVHLRNAGASADELESYRVGLSKLLNSLSREGNVAVPVAVDAEGTLFRVRLRDYAWDDHLSTEDGVDGWEEMVKRNPYAFPYADPNFENLQAATGSRVPVLNGDWLVYAASVSPLYEEVIPLPPTVDEFLAEFGVEDVAENVRTYAAVRAGFYQSGVSVNNRMIERHDNGLPGGYCWVSYDFASSAGDKNLFAHPLDDGRAFRTPDGDYVEEDGFVADGGEMICSLPNGLQVYYLSDAQGRYLAQGPLTVVSDPNNTEGGYAVLNGRSCMNCHHAGTIAKPDEIADALAANVWDFTGDQRYAIEQLYRPADAEAALTADGAAFVAGAAAADVPAVYETEFVWALSQAFAEPLTVPRLLAELGLDPNAGTEYLEDLLESSPDDSLKDDVNQIFTSGTVDRSVILPILQRLICAAQQSAVCPGDGEHCSSPDFDFDGDGTLDAFGLPCPVGTTCLDETAGDDAGACAG